MHKPGECHALKYNYKSPSSKTWTNEGIKSSGEVTEPYFFYDSDVYYFVCTPHTHAMEEASIGDTSVHHCVCMFCGKTYSEAHVLNASGSACTVCGRKPPFTTLKYIGEVGLEIALPQTNDEAFMRKLHPDNNNQ